jgi:hypothetical protein
VLCRNGFTVHVEREQNGFLLTVHIQGEHSQSVFPTDAALLAGVVNGYSYQVAGPQGGLTLSNSGDAIAICFEDNRAPSHRCLVPRADFDLALRGLGEL